MYSTQYVSGDICTVHNIFQVLRICTVRNMFQVLYLQYTTCFRCYMYSTEYISGTIYTACFRWLCTVHNLCPVLGGEQQTTRLQASPLIHLEHFQRSMSLMLLVTADLRSANI